jgi:tetratricopeptide (TPR) repeat protein
MKRTVFLSYSSAQSEAATRIELSLKGEGHAVFRDRSALPPGESFDAQIRAAIEDSDLFIFLISRESVSEGRYTLTELKFAEQKWGHPAGHVLPVLTEPIPKDAIPEFLRAVTMLQPRGDVAAEVTAEVDRMIMPWWRWFLRPQGLALLVLVALLVAGSVWQGLSWYLDRRGQTRQAAALLKQGQLQAESGNYALAWRLLEQASAIHPASTDVIDAQERLAMEWLDKAVGTEKVGLKDIADKVSPVLSRGAVSGKGERAADLLAHLGWADFLRLRQGVPGLDPVQLYRRAIDVDPGNVFAHTMWGFEILRIHGPLAEANRHFMIALESRREREYVRGMQISALHFYDNPSLDGEVIRVANEMRTGGETMPADTPHRSLRWTLWSSIYWRRFGSQSRRDDTPQFLSTPSPADHLATFRWLYPEDRIPKDKYDLYLYILAQLQERNGDRTSALLSYRQLLSRLASKKITSGRMVEDANAAIKRLST